LAELEPFMLSLFDLQNVPNHLVRRHYLRAWIVEIALKWRRHFRLTFYSTAATWRRFDFELGAKAVLSSLQSACRHSVWFGIQFLLPPGDAPCICEVSKSDSNFSPAHAGI
jgi:hypothetical protein